MGMENLFCVLILTPPRCFPYASMRSEEVFMQDPCLTSSDNAVECRAPSVAGARRAFMPLQGARLPAGTALAVFSCGKDAKAVRVWSGAVARYRGQAGGACRAAVLRTGGALGNGLRQRLGSTHNSVGKFQREIVPDKMRFLLSGVVGYGFSLVEHHERAL